MYFLGDFVKYSKKSYFSEQPRATSFESKKETYRGALRDDFLRRFCNRLFQIQLKTVVQFYGKFTLAAKYRFHTLFKVSIFPERKGEKLLIKQMNSFIIYRKPTTISRPEFIKQSSDSCYMQKGVLRNLTQFTG